MIEGGRVQLQQVLLNLILNAADAMSGTEARSASSTIRTELDGADVRLCVVDRGSGIAADDLKKVFDAFWSTKDGGMGIGLAICQSIVAAHRGSITASQQCRRRRDVLRQIADEATRMTEASRRRRSSSSTTTRAC